TRAAPSGPRGRRTGAGGPPLPGSRGLPRRNIPPCVVAPTRCGHRGGDAVRGFARARARAPRATNSRSRVVPRAHTRAVHGESVDGAGVWVWMPVVAVASRRVAPWGFSRTIFPTGYR